MFNFDKDLFITKVKKHGIEISRYSEHVFICPELFAELPSLTVSCMYDAGRNAFAIGASMPISENTESQTVNALCDRLNSIAKFYTGMQDNLLTASMELNFSEINYTDDDDAMEYAAVFVLLFKQEFDRFGVKAFQYAATGNINYLI